jgi:hypothetical protein
MFLLFYSLFFTKYLCLCTYKKLHNVTSPWLATSEYLWTLKPVQHNIRTNSYHWHEVSLQSRGFIPSVMWSSVVWVAPHCSPRVLQRIGTHSHTRPLTQQHSIMSQKTRNLSNTTAGTSNHAHIQGLSASLTFATNKQISGKLGTWDLQSLHKFSSK